MPSFRQLPPLHTLAFFEAAARLRNFTAAAQELGSSQPAVSQRISLLEDELGVPLFKREHRGVSLTVDGAHLFDAVHESLGGIRMAVAKIRSRRSRQVLTVWTDFGFATYWLLPRLSAMRELVPTLDVRIVTSQNQFDIRGESVDLAIAFGSGQWSGCKAEILIPEVVIPVCSPGFRASHALSGRATDLPKLPLLHLESTAPIRWLTWESWFSIQLLTMTCDNQHLTLNNYALVIQAAIAGQGVAMGWIPLINELVQSGQLVHAADQSVTTESGYFLVYPNTFRPTEPFHRFCEWIRGECRLGASDGIVGSHN